MANSDDRKKRIMEHLSRTKGDFFATLFTPNSAQRKQQILDHARRTRG